MNNDVKSEINVPTLFVLILVLIALCFSFIKYMGLGFIVYTQTECNHAESECVTNGDAYYEKFFVEAKTLDNYCGDIYSKTCLEFLTKNKKAEKLSCQDYLEEGEECSLPDNI